MSHTRVLAVSSDSAHHFTKPRRDAIVLVAGQGVEGDAHAGTTVQHRSRVRRDPTQPNLRQVHLIHRELFDEVDADVSPGDLGENITTEGIDVLALPRGTVLRLGADAVIEVTGLRNPCVQIDRFEPGLMKQLVGTDAEGNTVRKAGVMAIVLVGGRVQPGDPISVELPAGVREPLTAV